MIDELLKNGLGHVLFNLIVSKSHGSSWLRAKSVTAAIGMEVKDKKGEEIPNL